MWRILIVSLLKDLLREFLKALQKLKQHFEISVQREIQMRNLRSLPNLARNSTDTGPHRVLCVRPTVRSELPSTTVRLQANILPSRLYVPEAPPNGIKAESVYWVSVCVCTKKQCLCPTRASHSQIKDMAPGIWQVGPLRTYWHRGGDSPVLLLTL